MPYTRTQKLVGVSFLSAIAYLIMLFEFPIPLFPIFLKLDFSDLPALIGAIVYGPGAGIAIEALKNILNYLSNGSLTGIPIGELANFVAGSTIVVVTSIVYRRRRTIGSLISGMILATLTMSTIMAIMNYYVIFPAYVAFLHVPLEAFISGANKINHNIENVLTLIVFAVTPFNLLKGLVLTLAMLPIYQRVKHRIQPLNMKNTAKVEKAKA